MKKNNLHTNKQNNDLNSPSSKRIAARRLVFIVTAILVICVGSFITWSLQSIILPCIVGLFAAFMCFPILNFFIRIGIPRQAGILLLFTSFLILSVICTKIIVESIPNERDRLVYQTRFQYKLNDRYKNLMGIKNPHDSGNFVYKHFGRDLDQFINAINGHLKLDREEQLLFIQYRYGHNESPPIEDKYYNYFLKNNGENKNETNISPVNQDPIKQENNNSLSYISVIMELLQTWILMPFVFIFVLIDNGEIKRFFVSLVPNRIFEVSLSVIDKVNIAIINCLRGMLIECLFVGLSYFLLLLIIGVDFKLATIIGFISGFTNAVPLLGPLAFFIISIIYAIMVEDFTSFIPFITQDNLFIAICVCAVIVLVLDNVVYQPVLVGSAVSIHPLVIFLGVIGGSLIAGFAGVLLAIPVIVVIKEFFQTLFKELKDYSII